VSFIDGWIRSAVAQSGAAAEPIAEDEAGRVRAAVEERYARHDAGAFLWERLGSTTSRQRSDGWRDACEFVGDDGAILFFDVVRRAGAWRVRSGADLCAILDAAPSMELYLTDDDASYLLAYNDHEFLIGAGAAAYWVGMLDDD
jgi:hypothetical protein